jgi:hypothetical protein
MARLTVLAFVLLAGGGVAHADLRSFTHTYEYSTVPEGRTAVELWHTEGRLTWHKDTPQFYEQIVEIEHGITDKWDFAFYTVFDQTSAGLMSEPFHLGEVKLETRYRFADRGEWPVDTLVYLELSKAFGESLYEIEGKVIVARDFDKITVAANAITEIQVGHDAAETEPELGFAVGATYQAHPKLRLGAETWGQIEEEELYLSAGPAVSWAAASNFWIALTAGFGLTDEAEKFTMRGIIGIEL